MSELNSFCINISTTNNGKLQYSIYATTVMPDGAVALGELIKEPTELQSNGGLNDIKQTLTEMFTNHPAADESKGTMTANESMIRIANSTNSRGGTRRKRIKKSRKLRKNGNNAAI